MIMAGGKGERLLPLTAVRSKPSVPFGGKYRIVDFVLSNFVNSGLSAMYVLVQYKSQSLIEHLRESWRIGGRLRHHFITVVPPQMRAREGWYEGTADAVYQNLNLIEDFRPTLVAVFGADHIYRMDVRQMIQFHLEAQADVTVAALPVPVGEAGAFGIVEVDRGQRVVGFEEKPKRPKPMPQDPTRAFSSMGNYLFRTDLLIRLLERDASRPGSHDFGRNILPDIVGTQRVMAYDFLQNEVPGVQPHEEPGYWRDVGTLEAYCRHLRRPHGVGRAERRGRGDGGARQPYRGSADPAVGDRARRAHRARRGGGGLRDSRRRADRRELPAAPRHRRPVQHGAGGSEHRL
jgi:glucose-1-phosphate adenylyltransferase